MRLSSATPARVWRRGRLLLISLHESGSERRGYIYLFPRSQPAPSWPTVHSSVSGTDWYSQRRSKHVSGEQPTGRQAMEEPLSTLERGVGIALPPTRAAIAAASSASVPRSPSRPRRLCRRPRLRGVNKERGVIRERLSKCSRSEFGQGGLPLLTHLLPVKEVQVRIFGVPYRLTLTNSTL